MLMEKLTLATKEHERTWFGVLVGSQTGLLACSFSKSKPALEKHLQPVGGGTFSREVTAESRFALNGMIDIYDGRKTMDKVRLAWDIVSKFERDVCRVMQEIPKGQVTSYGLIAKRLSSGPRAVGTGVARNPWPLFVPCHRVVPADLEIGNYSIGGALSDYGCEMKRELLEREGVPIERDRIALRAVWVPTGA
jgi:O-6-methylguanine DNA methyltransferase